MAGISITGLISNSFDWQSVVNQLIAIDSTPITRLQTQESNNVDKLSSFSAIQSTLNDLQTAVTALQTPSLFTGRTVSSNVSGSSWGLTVDNGATAGTHTVTVSQLATAAKRLGATGIAQPLSTTDDVSGVTLASMPTATAVTEGNFTVDGQTVTIALTDSLADVFSKISTATGGKVTASYDHTTDKITLASTDSSEVVLGAANDTSNFLTATHLANNASTSVTSSAALGSVSLNSTLSSANLAGTLSPDGSGNGSFTINGVTISYNVNTDTINTVLSQINSSSAGVTASYDANNGRFVLTNNSTGDVGIGANEVSGGLLDAMGLTGSSTLQHGLNAQFTIDGGSTITTSSNTLSATDLGVTGLTIDANTTGTQSITVAADTASMKSAINTFISKFNTVQDLITSQTKITIGANGAVTTATLAGNHDVEGWGSDLRSLAFDSISGLSTTMSRLADIGIDFSGTSSDLSVVDQSKLDSALASNSQDVGNFFTDSSTGFGKQFTTYLTNLLNSSTGPIATQTNTLNNQNSSISDQINTLNSRLATERDQLTNAFLAMQDAQSAAASQQQTIQNMYASMYATTSSKSCWVARAVYGAANPRWILFRFWLLHRSPSWFRALYLRHGERFAGWLGNKPLLRSLIRHWMDTRIAALVI